MIRGSRVGAATDSDKVKEVESGKFKVERKGSSLTHFPLFAGPCSRTRKSHFTAAPPRVRFIGQKIDQMSPNNHGSSIPQARAVIKIVVAQVKTFSIARACHPKSSRLFRRRRPRCDHPASALNPSIYRPVSYAPALSMVPS